MYKAPHTPLLYKTSQRSIMILRRTAISHFSLIRSSSHTDPDSGRSVLWPGTP